MTPRLIVHGDVDSAPTAEVLRGLEEAGAAGYDVLERGGHAIDAVEAAVRVLEEDPQFNAGLGSVLNEDGDVEIDTGIVDGTTGCFAGVAALTGVRFPISVAAELLRRSPGLVLLAGPRARRFATQMGLTMEDLRTPSSWPRGSTRGAEIRQRAARSPAGVGDSTVFGAGIYAHASCAALCSGLGEAAIELTLAFRVVARCDDEEEADAAVARGVDLLSGHGATGGLIVYDANRDRLAVAHNATGFPVVLHAGDEPRAVQTAFRPRQTNG